MKRLTRTILIVAGGTGGHIFPGLAVAECLKEHDVRAVWLGSKRGLETRIVPEAGLRLVQIAVSGLRGSGPWRWLLAPLTLTIAVAQAILAVLRVRPNVVLGMGGFASGPGGLAAWICRRPLIIHEQNSIPGLTNLLLSRLATKVLQGFPGSFPARRRPITVGNPTRKSIAATTTPRERELEAGAFKILIVGGSRGARALNEGIPSALAKFKIENVEVLHQCGRGNRAQTEQDYENFDGVATVTEFIDDVGAAYRWATIVVCRAGALTIAELAAAGVAAILVPYPHAVDDHQTANAKFLLDANAALMVTEGVNFEQRLADSISKLYQERAQITLLAERAGELATLDAASAVAAHCRELLDA
ncbi:MAG: UDP-N-acetylglucosamine--N-acetylmuramyl-(pentapeptide) pyrophosphoryl-undecaprenol N-acetylglucosamine transferase [Gammaproteobacteria bacterium]|jgi:UDP-N-acetylglucosamine--N-acetylmuramyl-(pentapeptide) pyrophosphoryl-undecaprenol N-acetylglucosamine transferase